MQGTTYITTPSTDEIETAWFNLMQGELGIDEDWRLREFVQGMIDHMRAGDMPIMEADGEPMVAVSSAEVAKRVCLAYAALFYGDGEIAATREP